jgi:hypothetical protein
VTGGGLAVPGVADVGDRWWQVVGRPLASKGPDGARCMLTTAQLREHPHPLIHRVMDPGRPCWLITEPGMGYRFQPHLRDE